MNDHHHPEPEPEPEPEPLRYRVVKVPSSAELLDEYYASREFDPGLHPCDDSS